MSLHFLNLRKSLNTLKKNERHNLGICEIIVSERRRIRTPFGSQHLNGSEGLLKSAPQHFC